MFKIISFCIVAILISYSALVAGKNSIQKSTGAHPGSSGAPGEPTCAKSGCHADAKVSSGESVNTLTLKDAHGNEVQRYTPGESYNMTVRIVDNNTLSLHPKFGFQIVALDEDENSTGEFILTDAQRTQIQRATVNKRQRTYVSHRIDGIQPVAPYTGEWSFTWTAPSNYSGPITFYYCTNSANNDNTNKNDAIFTSSVTIQSSTTDVSAGKVSSLNAVIYPNPVSDVLHITYTSFVLRPVTVGLYTMQGRQVQQWLSQQVYGQQHLVLPTQAIPAGHYYVEIRSGAVLLYSAVVVKK